MLKGALAGGGQLPNFLGVLGGAPAALRAYARFRSELRHGTLQWTTAAADRAGGGRAPGQRVRAVHAPAHGARRRARPRRDRARARVRLARRARGGAAAVRQGAARERGRRRSSTSSRRRARPAGRTSRSSRPWPRWRSPRSRTSSPARPTSRWTARPRARGSCRPRERRLASIDGLRHRPATAEAHDAERARVAAAPPTTGPSSWSASAGPARSCSS